MVCQHGTQCCRHILLKRYHPTCYHWSTQRRFVPTATALTIFPLTFPDVIQAWMTNGITHVVGDNTRPVLMNSVNEFWPLTSTVAANGWAGLTILPRWATTIFYNCDTSSCTVAEWVNTSGGSGDFTALLADAKATNTRHLFGLHQDGFMFHQANMRADSTIPSYTVGSQSVKSLLQIWVETVTQEMSRLTTWPLISLRQDDMATQFRNRQTRDGCSPNMVWNYSADNTKIVGATITANGNTCSVPIFVSTTPCHPRQIWLQICSNEYRLHFPQH